MASSSSESSSHRCKESKDAEIAIPKIHSENIPEEITIPEEQKEQGEINEKHSQIH